MNENRKKLLEALPRDMRTDLANDHRDSLVAFSRIFPEGKPHDVYRQAYHSFLAGWDAAMKQERAEVLEENETLHGLVIDLMCKFNIKQCEDCRGHGIQFDPPFDDCPTCNGERFVPLGLEKGQEV